jgi:purine-nucleoside phosphorylase
MELLLKEKIAESVALVHSQVSSPLPTIAVIMGSGLGRFAEAIENPVIIPTADIPHYPRSTVPGHHGRWFIGRIDQTPLIGVQGRVHYYEGYSLQQVGYPVHLLASLGVKILIVTTASGGVNPAFKSGDLMIITDQINFAFGNPLIGRPENMLGPRFPNMYQPYDLELIQLALQAGADLGLELQQGVFCWMTGPAYETAAEVHLLRQFGGDAVSMSTAPEVIVARQRHLRVLGISLITNPGTGIGGAKLTHKEVTETANRGGEKLGGLLRSVLARIHHTTSAHSLQHVA